MDADGQGSLAVLQFVEPVEGGTGFEASDLVVGSDGTVFVRAIWEPGEGADFLTVAHRL